MNQRKITALNGSGQTQSEVSQDEILTQHKQESRIDSRVIAERAGIQHENLVATIKVNKERLRELGSLPCQSLKEFFDSKQGNLKSREERPEVSYLLNESQFDYTLRIIRGSNPERMNLFKLDVTKAFSMRRVAASIRREYLPGYHESRDSLKALGALRHHYINLARAENRVIGLSAGERGGADEQQLGLLVVIQKIELAAFDEAVRSDISPGDAVREVARRMEAFATLITSSPVMEIRE